MSKILLVLVGTLSLMAVAAQADPSNVQGVRRDVMMGKYLYLQPQGTKPNAQISMNPNITAYAIDTPDDMKEVNKKMLVIEGKPGKYPFGFQIIYQDNPGNDIFPHNQKSIRVMHSVSPKPQVSGINVGDIMFPGFEPKNFFNSPWENIVSWVTRTSTVREIELKSGLNFILIQTDFGDKIWEGFRPPKANKNQAQEFALQKLESNNDAVFAVFLDDNSKIILKEPIKLPKDTKIPKRN